MDNVDKDRHNESVVTSKYGMRLGKIGFMAMNNPIRRWIQKHIEFRIFNKHLDRGGIDLEGGVIMDAGCGSGYSTQLIVNGFHPSRVIAFDYMPEQVQLARKRKLEIDFFVGDLRRIEAESGICDAVFIFGVLHHIPEWRQALSEVARVLKPGGVLLVDEPRYLFTWQELESGFKSAGMDILQVSSFFFHYVHVYLCRKLDTE